MALYGLSVFLETPKPLRKGRKRYIAASFILTALSAMTASVNMAEYFQILFKATSPSHWSRLLLAQSESPISFVSDTGMGLVIMTGDALLVRAIL
jgi:hypothetical protein